MDQARALLNELMGVARDLPAEKKEMVFDFTHDDVCKCYLAGLCPHEVFVNTKSDLGPCDKRLHEEYLKKQYDEHGEPYREEYELHLLGVLERILLDLEKKRRKGKERLDIEPKEELLQILNPNREDQEEKVILLEMQMAEVMKKLEQAGEEGRVQEAEDMTLQVEKLKLDLEKAKEEANPYLRQEKKMEVCDICGAFLVMNDTQRRLEAHYEGRQHLGFIKVREKCAELKVKYQNHVPSTHKGENDISRARSRSPVRKPRSPKRTEPERKEPRRDSARRESYENRNRYNKRYDDDDRDYDSRRNSHGSRRRDSYEYREKDRGRDRR